MDPKPRRAIDDFNEFTDSINLRKRFPGYFNPWVFRAVIVLLIVFYVGFVLPENDWKFTHHFSSCPVNTQLGYCVLPQCVIENETDFYSIKQPEFNLSPGCTLPAGSYLDTRGPIAKSFTGVSIFLVLVSFVVNHLLWRRKK